MAFARESGERGGDEMVCVTVRLSTWKCKLNIERVEKHCVDVNVNSREIRNGEDLAVELTRLLGEKTGCMSIAESSQPRSCAS